MSTESNNVDVFQGNAITSSNNVNAFPVTIVSSTPPSPTPPVWETIEDFDWTAQATSAVLTGTGSATIGGKLINQLVVAGTPTMNTQCVNGTGLVHTATGLAGSGGSAIRWDLIPGNFNIGEPVLLEMLYTGVTYNTTGTLHCWGMGSGGHYSQVEWLGVQSQAIAGLTTANHIARAFSTAGGSRTITMAAAQPVSTNYLVQVWYDGAYSARVAMIEGQTTFLSQPIIGQSSPFNGSLDTGICGTGGSTSPQVSLNGIFATTMRCIIGVATQNGSFTMKRYRLSRPTRMV